MLGLIFPLAKRHVFISRANLNAPVCDVHGFFCQDFSPECTRFKSEILHVNMWVTRAPTRLSRKRALIASFRILDDLNKLQIPREQLMESEKFVVL